MHHWRTALIARLLRNFQRQRNPIDLQLLCAFLLVLALSFHAQRIASSQAIVEELDEFTQELALIQRTVRTGETHLEALLAELRHLYSRLGGGNLPPYPLNADQSVATVRNIVLRARRAGLEVRFRREDRYKSVELDYPPRVTPGSGIFRWLRARRSDR